MSAQNIDCGYSLEPTRRGGSNEYHNLCFDNKPPRRGGSNEYPQSMFLSKTDKNIVYPYKPQFYSDFAAACGRQAEGLREQALSYRIRFVTVKPNRK